MYEELDDADDEELATLHPLSRLLLLVLLFLQSSSSSSLSSPSPSIGVSSSSAVLVLSCAVVAAAAAAHRSLRRVATFSSSFSCLSYLVQLSIRKNGGWLAGGAAIVGDGGGGSSLPSAIRFCSSSSSWPMKLRLGEMIGRASFTSWYASSSDRPL